MLLVLETKAAAAEAACTVTDLAMRPAAARPSAERSASSATSATRAPPIVMAPTTDVLYDFIGRALCGLELF